MKNLLEWRQSQITHVKNFKTIKEARNWLHQISNGHGIVNCSCGDRIESCRCLSKDHQVAIVENGCEKCGGNPHPEMKEMEQRWQDFLARQKS